MITVFTSATASYLPNARILARSLAKVHPDWWFVLLFNDSTPNGVNWAMEPFDEVFFAHWLPIPQFRRWAFGQNVVEFCTATKGLMATHLLDSRDPEAVIYLDPDTVVFSPLKEVLRALKEHDIILTPHLTDPELDEEAIESHEIAALKHGTFNLGFFALAHNQNARSYLHWWTNRLLKFSQIDFERGLFTDQKWCNLAPYFFDGVYVLTDRAYNVATWNMRNRLIRREKGDQWTVNERPLRFYHFSGFGHDFAWADRELQMFDDGAGDLRQLWQYYKQIYRESSNATMPTWYWGHFANGVPITREDRRRYRTNPALTQAFPDPYSNGCFVALREREAVGVTPEALYA
jgi:hypothetical protein